MKNKILIILIFTLLLISIIFGIYYTKSKEIQIYEIPEQNVKYEGFEFGNVVDDGKQAIILKFQSDYDIVKIELVGVVIDITGQTIHTFDGVMQFGNTPTKNPSCAVVVDEELIYRVSYVSFTKVMAYTNEEIPTK